MRRPPFVFVTGRRTITEQRRFRFDLNDQLFVSTRAMQKSLLPDAPEPRHLRWVVSARQAVRRRAMDWRSAMIRTEATHDSREDEAAYAAGWTISGLATLGTIIAVWMFAI